MYKFKKILCDSLLNEFIEGGLTVRYVTDNLQHELMNLDKQTVLVHVHDEGEDVILLGDNEIDHVRFRFRQGRAIR